MGANDEHPQHSTQEQGSYSNKWYVELRSSDGQGKRFRYRKTVNSKSDAVRLESKFLARTLPRSSRSIVSQKMSIYRATREERDGWYIDICCTDSKGRKSRRRRMVDSLQEAQKLIGKSRVSLIPGDNKNERKTAEAEEP